MSRLPTQRGWAEIWADLQGPRDFITRAEIWAVLQGCRSMDLLHEQHQLDIWVDYWCSHCWGGSSVSGCGFCWWTHLEAGQGLCWFQISLGGPRCMATVVPVPDFSRSAPRDLCWWLCEHRAWDTQANCLHPHTWVGAKGMPSTVYFVNLHNRWQATPQSTLPNGQLLWRNTQWLLSQKKHSSPTHLTPQLRNGSGGFYCNNWGRLLTWQDCDNDRENSFAKTKGELKAINSKLNIAEELISDLQERIMEITQSK